MDDELKARLAPGAWNLLETPSDLLVALRDRRGGLFSELSELHPDRAVLAGDLAEMQPSDLLNFLHHGRRTGVLLARAGEVERGIVVVEGNVAWACSTSPGERLGELLARSGLIERARLGAVLAAQDIAGHRRLGQLLVDRGILPPDALARGLRTQVIEIFLGLLVARAGTFVFLRGVDRTALPIALALDMQALLLDGLRRLDEMELYRSIVPGLEVTPRLTGTPPQDGIDGEAAQLLPFVDGKRTLAELALVSALGEFEATKATYQLIQRGHVMV